MKNPSTFYVISIQYNESKRLVDFLLIKGTWKVRGFPDSLKIQCIISSNKRERVRIQTNTIQLHFSNFDFVDISINKITPQPQCEWFKKIKHKLSIPAISKIVLFKRS